MRYDSDSFRVGAEGAGALDWLVLPGGGRTNWELRGRVNRAVDRPWLASDHTAGPDRGRLYCSANVDAPYFLTSADGGRTAPAPAVP